MSFDHDMQMKVKDEVIKDLEAKLAESEKTVERQTNRANNEERIRFHYVKKVIELEQRLQEAEEVVRFYGDPEMWMIKNRNGWIQSSPKSHGDNELIQSYKHPKTDWIGSIQVGGKRARAYLAKHEAKQG